MRKKRSLTFTFVLGFIFLIGLVSAVPVLTIHSPQNTTYSDHKIPINVTSSEAVDFYLDEERTILLDNNTQTFNTDLYVGPGSNTFEIFANNSNGETSASVSFTVTPSNPVNVTGCGVLASSNTDYILQNDIGPQGFCLILNFKNNVNIDLNGKNSGEILLFDSNSVTIHDGTIRGTSDGIITKGKVSKILVEDVNINSNSRAFDLEIASQFLIRNVTANTSYGFDLRENVDITIKNSTMFYNNLNSLLPDHAFRDVSRYSKIVLEESNLSFSKGIRLDNNVLSDYFLRNSDINETVIVSSTASGANVYVQHRVVMEVTDGNNNSVPATLHITDNGNLTRVDEQESLFIRRSNPTSNFTRGTESPVDVWLTESLNIVDCNKTFGSCNGNLNEHTGEMFDFSNYTVVSETHEGNETVNVNLTGVNSVVPVDIVLDVPQQCTIDEMLDLNGDGSVNIQDGVIVLRKITGQQVSLASEKNCIGININPF